jgi:hypothetical protein
MTGRAPSLTGNTLATVNGLSPLQAALRYAALGLPVFPVAPVNRVTGQCGCKEGAACEAVGKHPLVRWADKASADAEQIRSWWTWKPEANIGVPTGQRSGLVVVDVDRQHDGFETRRGLEVNGYAFPPTVAAHTRSGGWHFLYAAPADRRVANTTAALAGIGATPGIDVRGDGGYIIVAPSIRPTGVDPDSGATQFGVYSWVAEDRLVAPAPAWVVVPKAVPEPRPSVPAAGRAPQHGSSAGRTDPDRRAAAALAAEVRRVASGAGDGRNNRLFQAAANCFEIVNTGYLGEQQVRDELTAAALSVGLGEREITQTLDAQWRRKQGVTRPGWVPTTFPDQSTLRFRQARMLNSGNQMLRSRDAGFGR